MQSEKTYIKAESHCNHSEPQAQDLFFLCSLRLNLFNYRHQQGQQQ